MPKEAGPRRGGKASGNFPPAAYRHKLAGLWALLKINPNDVRVEAVAVPRLTKALTDHRSHIRMEAANALGNIGAEAKPATAALQQATQDQDPHVADAAKAALAKIQAQ